MICVTATWGSARKSSEKCPQTYQRMENAYPVYKRWHAGFVQFSYSSCVHPVLLGSSTLMVPTDQSAVQWVGGSRIGVYKRAGAGSHWLSAGVVPSGTRLYRDFSREINCLTGPSVRLVTRYRILPPPENVPRPTVYLQKSARPGGCPRGTNFYR